MSNLTDRITELRNFNAAALARMAGVGWPDAANSPGAELLTVARDVVLGEVSDDATADDLRAMRDDVYDLVESVPTVYTHQIWQTFVDLQLYQLDERDNPYFDGEADMTRNASVTLAWVAENLAGILLDDLIEEAELDEEDDD